MRVLINPWWSSGGTIFSHWRTGKKHYFSALGWEKWARNPKAPPLHTLNERTKTHITRYA